MTKHLIYVIEDDQIMRSLLKTLFELEGFNVHVFNEISLESFIQEIQSNKPNAILMDVNLKFFNGIDALKKIRNTAYLKDLCVVISSGEYLEIEAMDAGATAFLLKPYVPNDLIQIVNNNL